MTVGQFLDFIKDLDISPDAEIQIWQSFDSVAVSAHGVQAEYTDKQAKVLDVVTFYPEDI